ncbi:MAG TPA: LamG-like jellyroll fold domain-containing protein [Candidatus Nanoarchaeia archaeon]|nr:LamG-like jellyroll fold domain-containing protein [Candidatus Nanoarchaeia archaeon]
MSLNGVLENSLTTSILPSNNSLPLLIGTTYGSRSGGYSSNPEYFNGIIDEVRIHNRSLSSTQIQALFNNRTDLIVSQELSGGDVWKTCVTPNDKTVDGTENCSNNVTVIALVSTLPSSSSPSGGGSSCTSSWDCTSWSACLPSLKQTRTCVDSNACKSSYTEEKDCTTCLENWICSAWSACANNIQTRTCLDYQNCGTMILIPKLVQSCESGTESVISPPESEIELPVPKPEEIVPPKDEPLVGEAFGSGQKSPPEKYIYNLLWLVFFILLIILFLLIIKHSSRRGESSLEELKEWIGHEKKMGIPDEQSIKILLQHTAWSKEEITRAFNELDLNNIGSKKIKKD